MISTSCFSELVGGKSSKHIWCNIFYPCSCPNTYKKETQNISAYILFLPFLLANFCCNANQPIFLDCWHFKLNQYNFPQITFQKRKGDPNWIFWIWAALVSVYYVLMYCRLILLRAEIIVICGTTDSLRDKTLELRAFNIQDSSGGFSWCGYGVLTEVISIMKRWQYKYCCC